MSRNKAIQLQDNLESLLDKRGYIKTYEYEKVGHYVEVHVGLLTLKFFIGDDLTLEERREQAKTCGFGWKGEMVAYIGFGSAMSDWNKSTITQALIEGLKIATR